MSVRHALLALLSEGPKYGLQLRQEFEHRTGEVWPLNLGQVYTTLRRLERDGLVVADGEDDGPQNLFRLTERGAAELAVWLRTPPDPGAPPPRDELVIKVLIALQLADVDLAELLQLHRRQLVELMQEYTYVKEAAPDADISLALVVDAELFRLDALIRWLDAVDGRLKHAPAGGDRRPSRVGTGTAAPADWSAAMTVLELRSVSKSYGEGAAEVHALIDVDLAVNEGELVAVMGPSGSGKSTLLTIAGTLEGATTGDVLVGGASTATMSTNDRARLRRRSIGYVFQDFNLLAGLTASENVALPLELDGMAARRARVVAAEALERLGVGDKGDRFPDDLSGGERQRVAIARAIVGDRHVLLADEPTGALDSVNGEAVMRLLRTACREGSAGVVVTHDAQLASWADRIVFLRDGRMIDQTRPRSGPESLLSSEGRP